MFLIYMETMAMKTIETIFIILIVETNTPDDSVKIKQDKHKLQRCINSWQHGIHNHCCSLHTVSGKYR